ncbi:MAG TPA: sodium:proton antiporter [Stellaceae bacterium]|nr:sodium:proton antiporter [Stellaceae bacterium]
MTTASGNAADLARAVPFIGLLLTIALAPLLAPRLWPRHYGKAATFWALAILVPDAAGRGWPAVAEELTTVALHEYLPFILLLGGLYVVAGGLRLTGTLRGTPGVNTAMLALGAAAASFIGTTGAAMVMVRPMIRANRHRRRVAHIFVFFILLVANCGGALTPLGDPPLFLGHLAGVPFFWPMVHLWAPAALVCGGLLVMFHGLDSYIYRRGLRDEPPVVSEIEKLGLEGAINLLLLAALIATVLLRASWRPVAGIHVGNVAWGAAEIASDALLLVIAILSLLMTDRRVRRDNGFAWAPMVEVAILFAAIFITLIPVTELIAAGPAGPAAPLIQHLFANGAPQDSVFFWATGLLSALLDNAPTYLVFLGFAGGDAEHLAGPMASTLAAISTGAVFFGALSYVGNAPNLMVKTIVEGHGIRMPGFFGYIGWAAVCLVPWLLLVDLIFFAGVLTRLPG